MKNISLKRLKEIQKESSRLIDEYGFRYFLETAIQEIKKQKFSIFYSYDSQIQFSKNDPDEAYQYWIKQNNFTTPSTLSHLKFAIVVMWDNSEKNDFKTTINSVMNQNYANSEIIAINLQDKSKISDKITTVKSTDLEDFFQNSKFDYVGFLLPGDVLHNDALLLLDKFLQETNSEIVYTDHDETDKHNARKNPFFKPDWSPYLFLHYNYIQRFFMIKKNALTKSDIPKYFNELNLYELFTNILKHTDKISHIPLPLCGIKKNHRYSYKTTISDALKKLGYHGTVEDGKISETYKINFDIKDKQKISIIIPTKNNKNYLKRCIETLKDKTNYQNYEVIIVDNDSNEETKSYLNSLHYTVLTFKNNFNFSKMCNLGARNSTGDYLLFLNDDVQIIQGSWLEDLVRICSQNDVGAVGAKLLYANKTIQHAGITILPTLAGFHPFQNLDENDPGYHGLANVTRECSAVTGACMLVKKSVYDSIGGWDEDFDVYYGDTDLCLRIQEKGFKVIYTPNAELIHYASTTIKKSSDIFVSVENQAFFAKRWKQLKNGDPYYNPNLDWNYQIKTS